VVSGSWRIEHRRGPAGVLHAEAAGLVDSTGPGSDRPVGRVIRVVVAEREAVVLGSAQPEADVDRVRAASSGTEVARRRSGGGAVLVGPDQVLWVDVVVPAGDPLWQVDVGRAGWWLGDCWAGAVAEVTGRQADPWRGGLVRTAWSSRVCFAGLGPGEVTVDGAKVVGVSQRRTRRGALFQSAALLRWRPADLLDVLALSERDRLAGAAELAGVAVGLGPVAPALLEALVARVGRAGGMP
jgi:lipoate-protein ligase A